MAIFAIAVGSFFKATGCFLTAMPYSQPIAARLPSPQSRPTRRLWPILLLLILLAAVGAAAWWWTHRPQEAPLRLITWNLQWFPGKKPSATSEQSLSHMHEVQAVLKRLSPDVLCLQELRSEADVLELILPTPGLQLQVISNFERPFGNSQQLAIVSNLPGIAVFAEPFVAHGPVDPPRGFACAAIDAGDGLMILAYTLHLKSNLGDLDKNIAKREESIQQLITHVQETEPKLRAQGWEDVLLVVAGDMNTDPTDQDRFGTERTFDLLGELGLESEMMDMPLTDRVTVSAEGRYPDACFDWVLVRPVEGVQVRMEVLMPGDEISDHRPVLLEVWR